MMNHAWLDLLLLIIELKYYPFMIILDKCIGNRNVLSPEICIPKETKDTNVKAFDMMNTNSIIQHVIQIKNRIIKHVNMNEKFIIHAKRLWLES